MTSPEDSYYAKGAHLAAVRIFHHKIGEWDKILISGKLKVAGCVADKKPALAAVVFEDAEGAPIRKPVKGLQSSVSFDGYFYIGDLGQNGEIAVRTELAPPAGAVAVRIAAHGWYAASVEVEEDFLVRKAQPAPPAPPVARAPTPLASVESAVKPGAAYGFRTAFEAEDVAYEAHPALIAFAFRDAEDRPMPGPHAGIRQSGRFGPFLYVGRPGFNGAHLSEFAVEPPPGARSLKAELFLWKAKTLRLSEPLQVLEIATPEDEDDDPYDPRVLIEAEVEVLPNEVYDVETLFAPGAQTPPRFALAAVSFLDAAGAPVAAPSAMSSSAAIGPFRYLRAEREASPSAAAEPVPARASLATPAGARRMRIRILPWRNSQPLAALKLEIVSLGTPRFVAAEGALDLPQDAGEIALEGAVEASGALPRTLGLLEIRFEDAQGETLFEKAEGLNSTERFLNVAPLERGLDAAEQAVWASFRPPAGALRLFWRLRPAEGVSLSLREPLALRRLSPDAASRIAALPPAALLSQGLEPAQARALREALPEAEIWREAARGRIALLGAAIGAVEPESWVNLSARLRMRRPLALSERVIVHPVFFDEAGAPLSPPEILGCKAAEGFGPARHSPAGRAPEAPEARLSETFLIPEEARFAAFHLFSLSGRAPVSALDLALCASSPDEAQADLDPAEMDAVELEEAHAVVQVTRDPVQRWIVNVSRAALAPRDEKLKAQAQTSFEQLVDLDVNWLPSLAPQPPYEPDPDCALHLLKVVYPDENSGGAVRSASILKAQAARGLRPVACMPLNGAPAEEEVWRRMRRDGVHETTRDGAVIAYPAYAAFSREAPGHRTLSLETAAHNQTLRAHRASLVHAASGFRGYDSALKGLALARANRIPFVYEVRSFHEHTWRPLSAPNLSERMTRMRAAQEDRCMREADAVVTISQAMRRLLLERGVEADRLFVAPNAIDPHFETLAAPEDVLRLRLAHGLLGRRSIGYISNFSEREGHAVLLEAFARLIQEGRDLRLVMVGDGPEREPILSLAQKRGLAPRIVAPGNVDHAEIRSWYHLIDLFVVPRVADFASDHVTPLKPFEAMAQKIPLILSDRPVAAEIAGESCERAAVFPAGDAEALARLAAEALDHPEPLAARAALARDWVLRERVWSRVVLSYDAAYDAARAHHARRNGLKELAP